MVYLLPKWRSDQDDDSMKDEMDDRIDGDLTTEELMTEIVEDLTVPADSDEDHEEQLSIVYCINQ